jgi:hypothetical protein
MDEGEIDPLLLRDLSRQLAGPRPQSNGLILLVLIAASISTQSPLPPQPPSARTQTQRWRKEG